MMRKFAYKGLPRFGNILLHLGGLAGIIIFNLFGFVLMAIAIQQTPPYWGASCFLVWFPLAGWLFGLIFINSYPTVWINERGLVLSAFFFLRVFVPWAEILDVGAERWPFGDVLIRARRITPFHRIYGWFYSHTLYPAFLVGPGMQDRDELLHEIRRRARIMA